MGGAHTNTTPLRAFRHRGGSNRSPRGRNPGSKYYDNPSSTRRVGHRASNAPHLPWETMSVLQAIVGALGMIVGIVVIGVLLAAVVIFGVLFFGSLMYVTAYILVTYWPHLLGGSVICIVLSM
jgi:hypothetical protein